MDNMVWLLLLSVLSFFAGGVCRGIFECVTIMKSMEYHWKRTITITTEVGERKTFYYWSYDLFVYNKDRNGDGKATWWEKTFPNDGGHRIKLLELFFYGLGATFLWASGLEIGYGCIGLPFVIWWIISFGFEDSFNHFKNKP